MDTAKPNPASASRMPVFAVSCWVLGLIGFSQLLVGGLALATRFEESREARTVIKEVPKVVVVRVPAAGAGEAAEAAADESSSSVVSRPPMAAPPQISSAEAPLPPPTPIAAPKVADPLAERMIKEARQARVAGDMDKAIMKLENALTLSPDDPTVHFELGLVHEQMGVFDVAAAHYEKVYQMGVTGAGALYEKAGEKIGQGFLDETAPLGKLSLGRVRIFKDPDNGEGQRVILTIPVQKAPGEDLELDQISVTVLFFNKNSKGEILQLEDKSWVKEQWMTLPFDFTGGEENLRMTYTIPPQDIQQERLFGDRSYYGQVVSLQYKGEVLDVQAWPRDLAARIPRQSTTAPGAGQMLPEFQDTLPSDFDPNLPLLPPLPE